MYAVHYQNLDILQMLLNNGAEVNVTANGKTDEEVQRTRNLPQCLNV